MPIGKKEYSRLMKEAAKSPSRFKTSLLNPSIASYDPLIFGFRFLCLNYAGFVLPDNGGSHPRENYNSLIKILETMNEMSQVNVERLIDSSEYSHCHFIERSDAIRKGFDVLLDQINSKNLFQLGINDNKERIIGYFSDDPSNLFEVCIIDMRHSFYPRKNKTQ